MTSSSGEDESEEGDSDENDDDSELGEIFKTDNESDGGIHFEESEVSGNGTNTGQLDLKVKSVASRCSVKKSRRPSFYLEEMNEEKDTDDSIIFADNSDLCKSATSSGTDLSLKSARSGDSFEEDYEQDEDEEIEEGNSKINRQFIYIQVIMQILFYVEKEFVNK